MKFRGINLLTRNIKYEAINPSLGKTAVDECGRRARSDTERLPSRGKVGSTRWIKVEQAR